MGAVTVWFKFGSLVVNLSCLFALSGLTAITYLAIGFFIDKTRDIPGMNLWA
jgi:hypothetical protein